MQGDFGKFFSPLTSIYPQLSSRFAARYLLTKYFVERLEPEEANVIIQNHMGLIRRMLFTRALRLLPLPAQVGVVEALATLIKSFPHAFALTDDQHLMSFLSELLKLASIADGDMKDKSLTDCVVDRNGFTITNGKIEPRSIAIPHHASGVFLRRLCVIDMDEAMIVCPEELPVGIQMRVSGILLLRAVIQADSDYFFEAESSTPVGKL